MSEGTGHWQHLFHSIANRRSRDLGLIMEEDLCDDELLYIRNRRKKYLLLQKLATETSISKHILKSQGILISALYLRKSHEKLTGFMTLLEGRSNLEFFKCCRVTKSTFDQLVEKIENFERKREHYGGKEPLDIKTCLMITLWYLGTQCTYKELSHHFGISLSTAHKVIEKIINTIIEVYENSLKWPSVEHLNEVENEFRSIANFPDVIGAIDICHIKIRAPEEGQKDYLDTNGQHSVILLAVSDADKNFTYVNAGFSGSVCDQQVFDNSSLGMKFKNDYKYLTYNDKYHIIGDSAFSLEPYLIVPFKNINNLSVEELSFNHRLSKTHSVIKNAFRWLKLRFRRLLYIQADIDKISKIITAACILHNITLNYQEERDLIDQESNFGASDNEGSSTSFCSPLTYDSKEGVMKRISLVEQLRNM